MIVKYAKDQRYDESGIATHCGQVWKPQIRMLLFTETNFRKFIHTSRFQRDACTIIKAFLVQVLPAVSANKLSELQEMAGWISHKNF